MSVASAHVTLEEFVTYFNGTNGDEAFWAHLSHCDHCQAQMRAWSSVAGGVRQAAPLSPPPPGPLYDALAAIDKKTPASGRRRLLTGSRAGLLAAAAAIVAGTLYVWPSAQPQVSIQASARAVAASAVVATECADLKVAAGTLESADGGSLMLRTTNGKEIKVAGNDAKVTRQVAGTLADITDGTTVMVRGEGVESGDKVTAQQVAVLPHTMKMPQMPNWGGRLNITKMMATRGTAMGTVSGNSAAGFTIKGRDGTAIQVATSDSTSVTKQETTDTSGLVKGKYTVAVGTLQDDGTLIATTIQQNTLTNGAAPSPPSEMAENFGDKLPKPGDRSSEMPHDLLPSMPSGFPKKLSNDMFSGLGCDADSIANTAVLGVTA
ncbi:hypothetical protein AB0I81_09155 [Nonomuraea sp. NPDC050404]|uniref:hypothetical protein n=1 Tax=Nonomuraea sp. NPDC050404 TaxID=3155783 RepID=UPI0033CF6626